MKHTQASWIIDHDVPDEHYHIYDGLMQQVAEV
jgi:hypothetical protein